MVAAFILLICIAPTLRIFTSIYQSQQEIMRKNQRDHLTHLIHAKITELLYKRQIHFTKETKNQAIALLDPELLDPLKKLSYEFEGTLTIIKSHTARQQEHPNQYLAQLSIKLRDVSPQAKNKIQEKKFENQDPADSFYDYYVYIDAGALANKDNHHIEVTNDKKNQENSDSIDSSNSSPVPSTSPSSLKKKGGKK
jgi:hypothetical protein